MKELYLEVGNHSVTAKSSKEKLFDFNTVTFKVKPTDGLFTAELEMDQGNLELVETHIYEEKETKQQESRENEEEVTVNVDDLVCVEMYICFGLSTIPDIFTNESQAFTVYIDGEEIQTLRRGSSSIDREFYFSKGVHKLSIRKNNTDDFDYDSVTFTVTEFTDRLNFTISHNQLLDTFKIEKDD